MVKKIIACADIHIRNYKRQEETVQQLNKFFDECRTIVAQYDNPYDVRIVVAGDVVHNKLDISGEGYILASWFLSELDKIAPTIIIAGNHDMNMKNVQRVDPITAIFSMHEFKQIKYLDKELNYTSGCIQDDNIVWCLYSVFDKFAAPNIAEFKSFPTKIKHSLFGKNPKAKDEITYIGLFHGEVKNAKTCTGYILENGIPTSHFDGIDFAILGHIHKVQCIKYNGVPLVYCGSLIQQDHSETVSGHGYILWDVAEQTYEEKNIANEEYGFYTFAISDINDIDNNTEEILNV